MDIEGVLYCSRCMSRIEEEKICPDCGYDHQKEYNKNPALEIGTLLKERYQLGAVIGSGGFGITYAAWDETLQMPVAVKEFFPADYVYRDTECSDEVTAKEGCQRQYFTGMDHFLREARVLSLLSEIPGSVSVHDYFEENGTAYIVMEYIRGKNLADFVKEKQRSAKELLDMFRPVVDALVVLHKQGILHRDITPSNIMVLKDGSMKLIDFGSAAGMAQEQSMVVVTKRYAPVEQYDPDGSLLGAWTDIYSLCVTMYETLTGEIFQDSMARLQNDRVVDLEKTGIKIKKYQARVIMEGVAVAPEKRVQSMEEFRARLYNLPLPEEIKRRKRFMRRAVGVSAAISVLAVLSAINFYSGFPLGEKLLFSLHSDGFHIYDSLGLSGNVTLPETKLGIPVVAVKDGAFKNERELREIVIPGSVKEVGVMAFWGCSGLEEIVLKDGVESLGEYAFADCPALRTVQVPESILYLNTRSFDGDSKFLTLWGKKGGKAERAAKNAGLVFAAGEDYDICENEDGTIAIGSCTDESDNIVLPSMIAGKKVTQIMKKEGEAFLECEQMSEIRFPEYLEEIPDGLFANSLGTVLGERKQKVNRAVLPPHLKAIGRAGFMNSDLEETELPEGLERIGESSFSGTDLKEIFIPDTVTRIEKNAFSSTDLVEIEIPASVEELGAGTFMNCEKLSGVILPENLKTISAFLFAECGSLKEILLPESVRRIDAYAFQNCRSLECIEIPPEVTEICGKAFSGCIHLKYVYIPESVVRIAPDAFEKCSAGLVIGGKAGSSAESFAQEHNFYFDAEDLWEKNIVVPESGTVCITEQAGTDVILPSYDKENHVLIKNVGAESLPGGLESVTLPLRAERIEDGAFSGCASLKEIRFPDSLIEIGHSAFFGCTGLKTVTLPESLEHLGQQAFEGCSNLEEAYIHAELVTMDTFSTGGAFTLCPKLTIFGRKGTPVEAYADHSHIPFQELE